MKFLIDENLPRHLTAALATAGHEAWYSIDLCGPSADDQTIWHAACDRQAVILTKDDDFHKFVAKGRAPEAVAILQVGNCSRAQAIKLVMGNLDYIKSELNAGVRLIEL